MPYGLVKIGSDNELTSAQIMVLCSHLSRWLLKISSHFESYLGFGSIQVDEIKSGTTIQVVCPTQPMSGLLMLWQLQEPGHQQAWSWPPKPEYSISRIRRVRIELVCKKKIICHCVHFSHPFSGESCIWLWPLHSISVWPDQGWSDLLSSRGNCRYCYNDICAVCYSPRENGGCTQKYCKGKIHVYCVLWYVLNSLAGPWEMW